jgi:Conserved protein containing a Zn-ribbon-like motif, possibly RNA-binding
MAKVRTIETLTIDSTVLCCNFVNTVHSWKKERPDDYFKRYADFVAWCRKLKLSHPERLDGLGLWSVDRPEEAAQALREIKEIRNVLHGFISAVARQDEEEKANLLPTVNGLLVDASSRQRLQYANGVFFMDQPDTPDDLLGPVWKAVRSLADLLTQHDLTRIKECPRCGWVFLDETKNGGRRWCNPKYCGTTDKMMRYHKRKRDSKLNKDMS